MNDQTDARETTREFTQVAAGERYGISDRLYLAACRTAKDRKMWYSQYQTQIRVAQVALS